MAKKIALFYIIYSFLYKNAFKLNIQKRTLQSTATNVFTLSGLHAKDHQVKIAYILYVCT